MYYYISHPQNIPVGLQETEIDAESESESISAFWGLRIQVSKPWAPKTPIKVHLDQVSACGKIRWCRKNGQGWEVGIAFDEPSECQKARMGEQVCQIENWQVQESRQGRHWKDNEACREWIRRYSKDFPPIVCAIYKTCA
jgi:hypothetical protein